MTIYTTSYTLQDSLPSLLLGEADGRLCLCDWDIPARREATQAHLIRHWKESGYKHLTDGHLSFVQQETPLLRQVRQELHEYQYAHRQTFDVPLLLVGTAFQRKTWQTLLRVPYGKTLSYQHFSSLCGHATAVRAVAHAVGQNRLSIFLPCHRIVPAFSQENPLAPVGNYAGGMATKQYLLNIEKEKI